jgi:hypothetical protein
VTLPAAPPALVTLLPLAPPLLAPPEPPALDVPVVPGVVSLLEQAKTPQSAPHAMPLIIDYLRGDCTRAPRSLKAEPARTILGGSPDAHRSMS